MPPATRSRTGSSGYPTPVRHKPLGRRDRPAGRPVAGRERLGHPPRRPGPGARPAPACRRWTAPGCAGRTAPTRWKRTRAHAVMRHLLDLDPVERLHRAFRLADRGAERREIVATQKMRRSLPHRRHLQRVRRCHARPAPSTSGRAPADDAVGIAPLHRREPRMPVAGHLGAGHHRHRRGLQMPVQRLRQPERIPVRARSACATCPVACTPASVRPAAATEGTSAPAGPVRPPARPAPTADRPAAASRRRAPHRIPASRHSAACRPATRSPTHGSNPHRPPFILAKTPAGGTSAAEGPAPRGGASPGDGRAGATGGLLTPPAMPILITRAARRTSRPW
jgi:hypothetical protein